MDTVSKGIFKNHAKAKTLVVVLAIAVYFMVFFSTLFVVGEMRHDCEGNHCPICAFLEVCQENLHRVNSALVILPLLVVAVLFLQISTIGSVQLVSEKSLLDQKARFNN